MPTWDGKAESLEAFEQRIKIKLLGTRENKRPLFALRLVEAFLEDYPNSSQAKRLLQIKESDLISSKGYFSVLAALKENIGARVLTDFGEALEKFFI